MDFKNITIKGDNHTFNKSIYSEDFKIDEKGCVWLDPTKIKLINSKYTSFQMSWDPIPGAKSYAVVVIDYDASRVFGFPFIHWLVSNIKTNHLEHGANIYNEEIIQGVNSGCPQRKDENSKGIIFNILPSGYKNISFEESIGFYPLLTQSRPHLFSVIIYGISDEPNNLEPGFYIGDLIASIQKNIVGIHNKTFWYKG